VAIFLFEKSINSFTSALLQLMLKHWRSLGIPYPTLGWSSPLPKRCTLCIYYKGARHNTISFALKQDRMLSSRHMCTTRVNLKSIPFSGLWPIAWMSRTISCSSP